MNFEVTSPAGKALKPLLTQFPCLFEITWIQLCSFRKFQNLWHAIGNTQWDHICTSSSQCSIDGSIIVYHGACEYFLHSSLKWLDFFIEFLNFSRIWILPCFWLVEYLWLCHCVGRSFVAILQHLPLIEYFWLVISCTVQNGIFTHWNYKNT